MAYGLAGVVLGAYLAYLSSALSKSRRQVEELAAKPSEEPSLVEETA